MVRDNTFWPNRSAVERAKEQATDMELPEVSGAEWSLSKHDIDCLALGAGILASGGGGNPQYGRDMALKALQDGKTIKITNPYRYALHACLLCLMCSWPTAYFVGHKSQMLASAWNFQYS